MIPVETLKTILTVLGLLGFPTAGAIVGWCAKYIKKLNRKQTALELGVQAMLRSQMISDYNEWYVNKGYAPIWAKQNFENVWVQYEALGKNGVMDGIHKEFMSLPTEPSKD